MNEKICYIVGAYESGEVTISPTYEDIVICADGGCAIAEKYGIKPHYVMGDFDSLGYVPNGENVAVFPSQKDDSDMALAVKYGFEKGYSVFHIWGGIGGRLDHTLANIQLLSYIADRGGKGILFGNGSILTVLKNSETTLNGEGYISIFSLSDKSEGVTLKGLKYALDNGELSNSVSLGLSNEFLDSKTPAKISVKNGTILIVING